MAKKVKAAARHAEVTTIDGFSQMGSGSLPTQDIPTHLVAIRPKNMNAEALAGGLRASATPIFTRVEQKKVLIDPRTLRANDEQEVVEAIVKILAG